MENYNLKAGIIGESKVKVSEDNTALKYGSGTIDVFATPAMIGLMEKAAIEAVDNVLPDGFATVGTKIDVKHLAATPIGMNVTAKAELLEIDNKKLKFSVEAYDDIDKIGEGIHYRYIINLEDFIRRNEMKLKNL
ncbi:MAG: thioesterase family protein [Actinomycetota bacterium]|nr:thioesterase family protein [Actinomycetota bacterium]